MNQRFTHQESNPSPQHGSPPGGHPSQRSRAPGGPESGVYESSMAAFRLAALDRIRLFNVRHTQAKWDNQNRNPLGIHGLAFFYIEAGRHQAGQSAYVLRTATRLYPDNQDVADLPRLLSELVGVVRNTRKPMDPRRWLADRSEPMSPTARFAGIGVSSVDSATMTWDTIRDNATGPMDLPGRCYVYLTDGTMILSERDNLRYRDFKVHSTHSLDTRPGLPVLAWRRRHDLASDPDTAAVWAPLRDLAHLLAAIDARNA